MVVAVAVAHGWIPDWSVEDSLVYRSGSLAWRPGWWVDSGRGLALPHVVVRQYPRKRPVPLDQFFCTVYYTPLESGITRERGFDVTPETRPGLEGRTFPRDFLLAVRKEGFGRMKQPVRGRPYLQYLGGGRYAFAKHVLGNRGNVLVPKVSCAVRSKLLPSRGALRIHSRMVAFEFGNREWVVGDTGGGLAPNQIDLYWGEDEPRGPGRHLARPAGTDMEFAYDLERVEIPNRPRRPPAAPASEKELRRRPLRPRAGG